MTPRLDPAVVSPALYKKFLELSMALRHSTIDAKTQDLVNIRASQINGCAFCVDMHSKEAKIHGERELRDRKSTRLNSSHMSISYAVFCLKKKKKKKLNHAHEDTRPTL